MAGRSRLRSRRLQGNRLNNKARLKPRKLVVILSDAKDLFFRGEQQALRFAQDDNFYVRDGNSSKEKPCFVGRAFKNKLSLGLKR
jgi:hypothetical protein